MKTSIRMSEIKCQLLNDFIRSPVIVQSPGIAEQLIIQAVNSSDRRQAAKRAALRFRVYFLSGTLNHFLLSADLGGLEIEDH